MKLASSAAKQIQAPQEKLAILNRLKRLEGQVRGLQRMVEDERSCVEIMTQLASARRALEATGDVLLEAYAEVCLQNETDSKEIVKLLKLAR